MMVDHIMTYPACQWPLLPLVALQGFNAFQKLRHERTNQRLVGVRAKRAAEAAAEEKDKVKP